jgi:hypothetical protein
MPCTLRDLVDISVTENPQAASGGIIYKPLHFLSKYDKISTGWVRDYPLATRQRLPLDLKGAASDLWRTLGFPQLDVTPTTAGQAPEVEIWLEYTNIASFDVSRGSW